MLVFNFFDVWTICLNDREKVIKKKKKEEKKHRVRQLYTFFYSGEIYNEPSWKRVSPCQQYKSK